MFTAIRDSKIPAADLGLFRSLYCLLIAALSFDRLGRYGHLINGGQIGLGNFIYLREDFAGEQGWWWLRLAFIAALLLAATGWFARWALALAVLSYTLLVFPVDRAYHSYDSNIVFYVLMILLFAPGVGRLRWGSRDPRAFEAVPAWPALAIVFYLSLVYLSAWTNKMFFIGSVRWLNGEALRADLYQFYFLNQDPLTLYVASRPWLCAVLAFATVGCEVLMSTLAFAGRARRFLVPLGLLFHFGIFLVMKIKFFVYFCPVYLVFIKWRHVQWAGSRIKWPRG